MNPSRHFLTGLLLLILAISPLAHAKKDRDGQEDEYRNDNGHAQEEPPRKEKRKRERMVEPEQAPVYIPERHHERRESPVERAPAPVYREPPRRYVEEYPEPPRYQERAPGLSLDQAVSQARRQTGGRVLSADSFEEQGILVHRVKMLTPDGRVRTLYFDEPNGNW